MRIVFAIMRMELMQYRRGILFWTSILFLSLYLATGYNLFLRDDMLVGQFLESSSYIVMVSALFGLLFGIIMSRREQDAVFTEVAASIPGDNFRSFSKLLAWLIVCFLLTTVASFEVIILVWMSGSDFLFFSYEIIGYISLYWGMTLFSCGILGVAIDKFLNNSWAKLPVVLIIWFVISPFNTILSRYIPIGLLSWINQGEREIDATYNGIEGLYTANSFIAKKIAFLTICLTIALVSFYIKKEREKSQKEKRTILILGAITCITFTIFIFGQKSPLDSIKVPINNYADYYLNQDAYYYTANIKSENNVTKKSFRVEQYDIKLNHIMNSINYSISITVRDVEKDTRKLDFTLFHGLDILSLEIDGNKAKWEREKDWIHIQWPEGKSHGKLVIQIKGSGGAFNQISETSFFLSSNFPWYPIPGIFVVAEKFDLFFEPQYNYIELNEPAHFRISVQSKRRVYSNLPKVGTNIFSGQAYGATLLSGMLIERKVDSLNIVGPPDSIYKVASSVKKIDESIIFLSDILKAPIPDIPKKIFVIPSFSHSSNYSLITSKDQLFVNEFFTRNSFSTINLSELESVFQAFFWTNSYRTNDDLNSYIFRIILQYRTNVDKKNTLLERRASDIDRLGDNAKPIAFLAQDILNYAQKTEDKDLSVLLQLAYNKSKEKNLELTDWKNFLEGGGYYGEIINR